MTPEQQLMSDIRDRYEAQIKTAVAGTDFPPSLVAAIVGNESGTNVEAARFEPSVLANLTLVLVGRKGNFGAISHIALTEYFPKSFTPDQFALSLMNLAISWGPMQIMGYEALAGGYLLSELTNPKTHFARGVAMLADFQKRFKLALPADLDNAEPYFRCWNGGAPAAKTYDPSYVTNGLARMVAYEALG